MNLSFQKNLRQEQTLTTAVPKEAISEHHASSVTREQNPYFTPSIVENLPPVPLRDDTCFRTLLEALQKADDKPKQLELLLDRILTFTLLDILDAKEIAIEILSKNDPSEKGQRGVSSILGSIKRSLSSLFSPPGDTKDSKESLPRKRDLELIQKACSLYCERYFKEYGMDPLETQCLIPSPHAPYNKFSIADSQQYMRMRLDTKYGQPRILTAEEKTALVESTCSDNILKLHEEACMRMKDYLTNELNS